MAADAGSKRELITYLIAVWMIINIALMLMLLPADYMDLNNWIELALWIPSLIGLFMMKKWGIALALFTLIYTLSTSVSILVYYQVWLNALRVIVNLACLSFTCLSASCPISSHSVCLLCNCDGCVLYGDSTKTLFRWGC